MLIRNPCSYKGNTELLVILNGNEITQVSEFKYLGIYIDGTLNFKHTEQVIGKISQRSGLLWRVRKCINTELARYLYQSFLELHFIYCSYVYDACDLDHKRKLQISQNKALRAILRVPNDYPSEQVHEICGIEWLGVCRAKATCVELYKLL